MSTIFVLAGEASGDLLGSHLISALNRQASHLNIWGVGGPKMRQEKFSSYLPMEEFQLMGFRQILLHFPTVIKQFLMLRNKILKERPDAVVLIDYPGFNLRLAKSLRKKGYKGKIIHYVSPTVWVYGKGRIKTLADHYDLLLTVLPFEPPLYSHTNLKTIYVGSPVVESVKKYQLNPTPLNLQNEKKLLALFPGSRRFEIENNFSLQLRVAKELLPNYQVAVSCSQPQYLHLIEEKIKECGLENHATIVEGEDTYPLMEACDLALAKSGTVTLELAMFHKPTAVVYQVDAFNRFVAKNILRLNITHVALANIIAGKTVQPEFVLEPFTEEELTQTVKNLALDESARQKCLEGYQEVEKKLGDQMASETAAKAIKEVMSI